MHQGNLTMTHPDFIKIIIENHISPNLIHFENSASDGFYVLKNHHRFEVFYREQGKDYNCVGFPSERDALEYLLNKLLRV